MQAAYCMRSRILPIITRLVPVGILLLFLQSKHGLLQISLAAFPVPIRNRMHSMVVASSRQQKRLYFEPPCGSYYTYAAIHTTASRTTALTLHVCCSETELVHSSTHGLLQRTCTSAFIVILHLDFYRYNLHRIKGMQACIQPKSGNHTM